MATISDHIVAGTLSLAWQASRMVRAPSAAAAMTLAIAALAARTATAQRNAALDQLESALPSGWSLLATGSELVIRHDRPCYTTGAPHAQARTGEPRSASAHTGPLVTVELRYRLEPRWTPAQLAAAQATNDRLAAELRAAAARYAIDAIPKIKGKPAPANPDQRTRLAAYDAAHTQLTARMVKLPRCHLGEASVFDGDDTYAQLSLDLDPPEATAEARRIVQLMAQHCTAP
jgi:hypothetical protein